MRVRVPRWPPKIGEDMARLLTQEEMAEAARRRPSNFDSLSAKEQWDIDKELGILDWEGGPPSKEENDERE